MPQIPIDNLHVKPYSQTRYGCIFAFENTLPVMVITALDGSVSVALNAGANSLGEWLPEVGDQLSKEQVESLLKGKTVKL